jgi:hypothetical protein
MSQCKDGKCNTISQMSPWVAVFPLLSLPWPQGHSLQFGIQCNRGVETGTLECSCGRVLSKGIARTIEIEGRIQITAAGRQPAIEHYEEVMGKKLSAAPSRDAATEGQPS